MFASFSFPIIFCYYKTFFSLPELLIIMQYQTHKLCTAPMLDWTDRHFRFMARLLCQNARLYSEMIHANALIYGDKNEFLYHNDPQHNTALQLGGSNPNSLAKACQIAADFDYCEINLNCGCPSPRVQKGSFGACLMREVALVADCLNAMANATNAEITVKHRIGIDDDEDYQVVADFVGEIAHKTPCKSFIIHARNAWLNGLSPKENRDIPPLKYDFVYRIKQDFSDLNIVINGGIVDNNSIINHLQHTDGVMVGRAAYHNPMIMKEWDSLFFNCAENSITDEELINKLYQYAKQEIAQKTPLRNVVKQWLGLFHGQNGVRLWRQTLSNATLLAENKPDLILKAFEKMKAFQAA
ncbi:MAG: tRNA dihydrouridine(20/20a) synthase DusA [Neisseriaceae bacterium]|nr:tRNA dihydrouridine(20/20a) synthase DusA [Neisseriaceae bacterium]